GSPRGTSTRYTDRSPRPPTRTVRTRSSANRSSATSRDCPWSSTSNSATTVATSQPSRTGRRVVPFVGGMPAPLTRTSRGRSEVGDDVVALDEHLVRAHPHPVGVGHVPAGGQPELVAVPGAQHHAVLLVVAAVLVRVRLG